MTMRTMVLLCGLLAASPVAAQFAGRWQVQVQTDVGECPSGEIGVRVEGNHLVATEAEGVTPWGYIEGNQIVANFRGGPDVLRAHGNLRGREASGAWSSPTRYCGGRWRARKID
jgi:hypothetical protein